MRQSYKVVANLQKKVQIKKSTTKRKNDVIKQVKYNLGE